MVDALFIIQHKKVGSQHYSIELRYKFRYNIIEKNCKGSDFVQIAICDDDKNIRELIGGKVSGLYPEAELSYFQSGEELVASNKKIDILFLDIQMTGKNGMETAREIRKKDKKLILIFVTGVEEYVYQAFDVGAFHYLVKPIDDMKFAEVLERAVEECQTREAEVKEPEVNYVMINNSGVHTKVVVDDIVYA